MERPGHPSEAASRASRVRLLSTGGNDYLVVIDRRPAATAHFPRYRTGEGFRAEAWVERTGFEPTELLTANFADFVREVSRMFLTTQVA